MTRVKDYPCTAVMTYRSSSLRSHTDNYNHICGFCRQARPLLWQIDAVMRDAEVGEGAGEWHREGGQEQGNMCRHGAQQRMRDDWRHLVRDCSISVPYTRFHSSRTLLFIHSLAPLRVISCPVWLKNTFCLYGPCHSPLVPYNGGF